MTNFTQSQIPWDINTIEKLHVWTASILSDLYGTQTAVEEEDEAVRVADSGPFYASQANPPTWRIITRTSIPLGSTWKRTGQIWDHAQNLGDLPLPSDFVNPPS